MTLTGLPGTGKSELARELIARLAQLPTGGPRPVDDAVWEGLTAMRSATDVRSRIAALLELQEADTDELLARQLKSRRSLLVLDNAEDVLVADRLGFRRLLEIVLRDASGVRVLLTSRQTLGDLEGIVTRERRVDLLPAPHDREAFLSAAGERLSAAERETEELTQLVRTDRLREAEANYAAALPIYRQIEARLGEANTLKALGNLSVADGLPRRGFNELLSAIPLYEAIESPLG